MMLKESKGGDDGVMFGESLADILDIGVLARSVGSPGLTFTGTI